jgi:hypothetical protein
VVPGQTPVKPNQQGAEGSWMRPDWDEPAKWRAYFETGRWPSRHAWIIVGNEPNLGREWGGEVDATSYAKYLAHFLDVFKGAPRFDVVSGALDASNTTALPVMQDALEFLDEMGAAVPGIFERLPAWASNPYRVLNRGPSARFTHRAYEVELDRIGREMPVLITEAGHLDTGDEDEIARFYEQAFRDWMADPKVVAATPLFWHPDRNDFWMFELDKKGAFVHKSPTYELMRRLPRVAGSPQYAVTIANIARTTPYEVIVAEEPPAEIESVSATTQPLGSSRPGDNWELEGKPQGGVARGPASQQAASEPQATSMSQTTPVSQPTTTQATSTTQATTSSETRPPADRGAARSGASPSGQTTTADSRSTGAVLLSLRVVDTGGQGARLRAEPSRQADSIAVLPDGTVVQALGPEREGGEESWRRVRAEDGAEGWVASDLLAPASASGD